MVNCFVSKGTLAVQDFRCKQHLSSSCGSNIDALGGSEAYREVCAEFKMGI